MPISITAFTDDTIEQNNFKGIVDYLQSTPNVSFTEVTGQGPKGANISIRGISDLQNAERVSASSAFGIYVDDFNVGTAARGTPNPPLYDIEQIEILRGPQGTYFGRNSTGGAINVTTKQPTDEFYAQLDLDVSSYETYSIGGVLNIPFTDTFFVRTAIQLEDSGGQIENVSRLSGGGNSGYDNSNIRVSAHWDINDRWSADLSINTIQEDSDMENLVAIGIAAQFGGDINDPVYTCGLSITNKDQACRDTTGFTDLQDEIYNLRVKYTGGNLAFTSITGRSTSDMNHLRDLDSSGRPLLDRRNDYSAESVSQEFRLQNIDDEKLAWTIGAIAYEDELVANNRIIARDLYPPFYIANDYPNENTINLNRDGWAVFADVGWKIYDNLAVNIGGRYSYDEESQLWENTYTACPFRMVLDPTNPSTTPLAGGCELRPDHLLSQLPVINGLITGGRIAQTDGVSAANDGTDFSPRVALIWGVNNDWTVYGVISQGYKSAGARANPDSGGANSSVYGKEKLTNIELGFKATPDQGRTRLNAAIFSMNWDDLQVTQRESACRQADGSLTLLSQLVNGNESCQFVPLDRILNAAEASAKGIEISLDTLISDNWKLGFHYGYLKAEYDDYPDAPLGGSQPVNLSGFPLPNSPENTGSVRSSYTFNFGKVYGYFNLEANYRDTVFNLSSLSNPLFAMEPFTPDAFWLLHLRAGLQWGNQSLAFNINNILDNDYVTGAGVGAAGVIVHPHETTFSLRWTIRSN